MDRTTFLKLASMLSVALLIGCTTVGPDYEQPETEVPDAWHTAATEGLQEGEATLQTWWRVFDDELLDDLVMRSAGGNLDLRVAMWRVEEARALRGVVAGVKKPQVGFSGDASRAQPSDNGLAGDLAPPEGFDAGNLFSLGFGAVWEIDVFGRIRRQVEAADATAEASLRPTATSWFPSTPRPPSPMSTYAPRRSGCGFRMTTSTARRTPSSSPRIVFRPGSFRPSTWPRPSPTSPTPTR